MQWKLQKYELGLFVFNVLGGLVLYFVVQPHLGSQSWSLACIPASVSVLSFLIRPLAEHLRSGSGQ